ncbi:alpha-N-acetylgalactosaminide alpha-2,6-sialyltransferase 2 [Lampris incognitus]|uniref:alpha-N-acetylgalactosaminide alpha-2,6-sialyltransferase 2 n=1 Tax=Lampris incognitus TaxID=2546036 RepID=UPI0024B5630B|nr:alpha-N-acetylgalactosaminide alpha-2,6-sialyltransferase 2 [Lampris incognitus]XP_056152923.1 alpha-N-acetylgalactosaminide alpha-2,6-sialyltransferase 2 [Lampris incognitus]
MGRQRRLVLCFLAVSSLLLVYILCLSFEISIPWHMVVRIRFLGNGDQRQSRLQNSEQLLGNNTDQWTHMPPTSSSHPKLISETVQQEHTNAIQSTILNTRQPKPSEGNAAKPNSKSNAEENHRTTTKSPNLPAARITEPPYIGDKYSSEDFPLQTDCPDSIRKKVSATDFRERFLHRVPLFQWAKYATPEEYQRLSRYPGAHGWPGEGYYDMVMGAVSALNSSAHRQMFDDWKARGGKAPCIRCAVVGNGGILNDSKKGQEIDGHDYVFRTNGAVIQGFERDVGSRTTHYIFSTNTMRNSMRGYAQHGYRGPPLSEETRYIFLPDQTRDYILIKAVVTHTPVDTGPERSSSPPSYFGENASAEKFKMFHPDFIRYIRNRFLRSPIVSGKHRNIYRPSTGAVMLLSALHTCDKVSAYGFMTPDYSKYSDHYFDTSYHPVHFYINHDFRLEMKLWQQLQQAGLIQLYMRQ